MRKVVNGLLYDTDGEGVEEIYAHYTAEGGEPMGPLRVILYRTARGRYFLCDPDLGLTLRPMTPEQAFNWLIEQEQDELAKEEFPKLSIKPA